MIRNKMAVIVLFFLLGCTQRKIKNENISDSSSVTIVDSNLNYKVSPIIIIDSLKVAAKLKVTPYTLDSIIAEISIFNNSYKPVWLYKPILPTNNSSEDAFAFLMDKKSHDFSESTVRFKIKKSNHQYFGGGPGLLAAIIPSVLDSNLLKLNSGDTVKFTTNLSLKYDFKDFIRHNRNVNSILIDYHTYFPYIENGHHLYLQNKNDSVNRIGYKRPAYFSIGCKLNDTFPNGGRVKIIFPAR